jgi:upstream activation factor subunit UAF30
MPKTTKISKTLNNTESSESNVAKKKVIRKKLVKKEPEMLENTTEHLETEPVPVQPSVEPSVEPSLEEKLETTIENNAELKKKTKKLTKEKIQQDLENLFEIYKEELAGLKKKPAQKVSLQKYLTSMKNDVFRLLKIRNKAATDRPKSNSGFNKPVKVSQDLASFIKVKPDDEVTRVLITQKLCAYVKDHNLQNPQDRREILPDTELKKLFKIDESNPDDKLTYYSIQRKIQSHIIKI